MRLGRAAGARRLLRLRLRALEHRHRAARARRAPRARRAARPLHRRHAHLPGPLRRADGARSCRCWRADRTAGSAAAGHRRRARQGRAGRDRATIVVARLVVPRVLGWVDAQPQPRGLPARDPRALHRHRVAHLAGGPVARARRLPRRHGGRRHRVRPPRDGRHPAAARRLREHLLRLARACSSTCAWWWRSRCSCSGSLLAASSSAKGSSRRSPRWRCASRRASPGSRASGSRSSASSASCSPASAQADAAWSDARASRPLLAAGIASACSSRPLLVRVAPHVTRRASGCSRRSSGCIGVRSIDEAGRRGRETLLGPRGHRRLRRRRAAARRARSRPAACPTSCSSSTPTPCARRGSGLPVYYGDATSEEALGHAHLAKARGAGAADQRPRGGAARGRHRHAGGAPACRC